MKLSLVPFMLALASASAIASDLPLSLACDRTHIEPRARTSLPGGDEGRPATRTGCGATMVKFVDPERRIAIPPSHPGVGW